MPPIAPKKSSTPCGLPSSRPGSGAGVPPRFSAIADAQAIPVRFLQGGGPPVDCAACVTKRDCPFDRRCAFSTRWNRVDRAIMQVYNETTIQDLLDGDRHLRPKRAKRRPRK
jgi:DNA-binding IscR family transcriptional regulator